MQRTHEPGDQTPSSLQYKYPEVVLDQHPNEVREIKRLGARCGRTFGEQTHHERARKRLRLRLEAIDSARLRYWASVVVIDHRWCGATGQGGFWAVASRCVNEEAQAILRKRSTGRTLFEVSERGAAPRTEHRAD